MHDVVLAAVLAAGSRAQPSTLAGMTLGNNVAQVLSRHPDAQKSADSSVRWWTWSVDGGGTVIVTADDGHKINRVDSSRTKARLTLSMFRALESFPFRLHPRTSSKL